MLIIRFVSIDFRLVSAFENKIYNKGFRRLARQLNYSFPNFVDHVLNEMKGCSIMTGY